MLQDSRFLKCGFEEDEESKVESHIGICVRAESCERTNKTIDRDQKKEK